MCALKIIEEWSDLNTNILLKFQELKCTNGLLLAFICEPKS